MVVRSRPPALATGFEINATRPACPIAQRTGFAKAAATALAEAGASPHQLMSWFGWKSLKQAELYTRAADQKKLAGSVVHLIGRAKA
jgi:hypothetical protein